MKKGGPQETPDSSKNDALLMGACQPAGIVDE
jgi:hypothetical protein